MVLPELSRTIGTLRFEDGKTRTGTGVHAANFRGPRRVAKGKMIKMSIFAKDGDVNNLNFVKAIQKSNDIL